MPCSSNRTDRGHAIGAIAALSAAQRQQVASTHVTIVAVGHSKQVRQPVPWRRVVVGAPLARRLQRPAVVQRLARPPQVSAFFDTLTQAADAAQPAPVTREQPVDLLLWQTPSLHFASLSELQAAVHFWGARRAAVIYRFARVVAREPFASADVALLRETQDDKARGDWLTALETAAVLDATGRTNKLYQYDALWLLGGDCAPRRFDDATLTDFAGLSSNIACECPRHLAELLMQLLNFEAYSAQCEILSPGDAALHAYLKRVAGPSRALFESALEPVAIQVGLMLPA